MQGIKKILSKNSLTNLVFIFYIISIVLDLHLFYNSISTLIRVVIITILFLIIFLFYSNKKEKKLLIAYFLALSVYIVLHLINVNNFKVSFITNYNNLDELLYFWKMLMNVFLIFIVYKLNINKDNFYKLITFSAFLISGIIVISNLFKIGYTSYNFLRPEYSIFDWFHIKNISFITSSTKGYFHLTNQISAILILYLPILFIYLKEKITFSKVVTIILVLTSLFMLGTRVSNYSVFIIIILTFIVYLMTSLTSKNFNKWYLLILVLMGGYSYLLFSNAPLLSRNLYYDTLFKEKEESKDSEEYYELSSKPLSELSNEELYTYLGYFNIDEDFYNTYYPLENDRLFYESFVSLKTTKINDTRFLEKKVIERVKELNANKADTYFGIGYDRVINIFNIESDYVMQYYALGVIGVILLLGVNIILVLFMGFKMLFNLKRYFTMENILLLFTISYYLLAAYFTGNILNAISTIIPASFVIGFALSNLKKEELKDNEYYLGFKTSTKSKEEILDNIFKSKKQNIIYNINPLIIMNFLHNEKVKSEINKSNYNIPDGSGIVLASLLTSHNIRESIPGVELMEEICERSIQNKYKIYLYGSKEESVKKTKEILEEKYPKIQIVGYLNGYNKDKEKDAKKITSSKCDILFVALGSPYQEEFIMKNKELFKDIKIIMPVGGSFDAISGNVKRAPKIFQKLKLEWLYRMVKEPKRLKNLFSLIKFGFLALLGNFWYNRKVTKGDL